jgi:transposase
MSTSPYSIDLRKKVIEFLEIGNTQREASKVFNISKTTVNTWCLRNKNEGHYLPRKRLGAKPSIEHESFVNYVNNHPDSRLEDIARNFGISASGARYWLKKVGFSYKKKTFPTWKQMKKGEINTKRI